MVIGIDRDNLLLVFESRDVAANEVASNGGWNIEEVDFYTDQGQRLKPKDDSSGVCRLVPHDRPRKTNLQALFAKAEDIALSRIPSINSIPDLKKALSWEDTI